MLDPQDRQLLIDALRPPQGYEVDHALATSFSLDLLALLVAPLAFSLFECQDNDDGPAPDRMAWLEAIRRHASRLTVFCQAGQIAVPRREQLLYAYLEDSVFEVTSPRPSGLFHPKVWLLRFTAPDQPVRYRFLCLSRNLTFDRSWDTALALDGQVLDRRKAIAKNHPLGDFVAALPSLCRRNVPPNVHAVVNRMQEEVRKVEFELPADFDEVRFWPLGIGETATWPFDGRIERMLIVSPFLKEPTLNRLTTEGEGHVLISRLDEMQRLRPKALSAFKKVYALSGDADAPEDTQSSELNSVPTTGLHAKLYVADDGWNGRIWTGSANATNAAFGPNVEFLVELTGKKSRCGVDAILRRGDKNLGLLDFLLPFEPAEPVSIDADQEALEDQLDDARRRIVDLNLGARASASAANYVIALEVGASKKRVLPAGTNARTWPITLPEASAGVAPDFSKDVVAQFGELSFESLTSFFAFELSATKGRASLTRRFVLNIPLLGAPTDRHERILRYLLRDRNQVMRFLLYLLGGEAPLGTAPANLPSAEGSADSTWTMGTTALFEQLVRALDSDPRRLDEVQRVVTDLRSTPEGLALLPEGFDEVWGPVWSARQEVASR